MERGSGRIEQAVVWLWAAAVAALAGWQVWAVASAMAVRRTYPFDIEWMEGATLLTGLRASQGLPFYEAPSLDYIPFIYPPLYAWILGALSAIHPVDYLLGRTVSQVCFWLAAATLVVGARRGGARWATALACGALLVSCYEESGTFFDLVRIDSLSLALLLPALFLGASRTTPGVIASGLFLAVAFTAKHHVAMFGFPILAWQWWQSGRKPALIFAAAAAGPALAFTLTMQAVTGGTFLTWLLTVPAVHGMVLDRMLPWAKIVTSPALDLQPQGALAECWAALPWTTTLALLALPTLWRSPIGRYWLGVTGVAALVVTLMRGHVGGYLNVLIPLMAMLSLLPAWLEGHLDQTPWGARWPRASRALVGVVLLLQLWAGRGTLTRYLPTEADRQQGEAVLAQIRDLPEPLLLPHAPFLAVQAGKAPSLALIALWDIDHDYGPFQPFAKEVKAAMRSGRWAAVVVPDAKLGYDLKSGYTLQKTLPVASPATRTGWPVRLRQVWVPKGEITSPNK